MIKNETDTKEKLILAGITEIQKFGFQNFSMRRVASECDVSCAAPYKHFRNKNDFVLSIIRYINKQWYSRQDVIISEHGGESEREQLVWISIAYIDFLTENPSFRSIIMLRDDNMSREQMHEKSKLSTRSSEIIHRYCESVSMPLEDEIRKTFIVRSIIYGAALMLDNGELEKNENSVKMIKETIEREFDLK